MDQKAIAYTLNASIIDACMDSLSTAKHRHGEEAVVKGIQAAEASLQGLRSGKLPDYRGFDPIVYAIWYHSCHVSMAYRIFRELIQMTHQHGDNNDDDGETHIVDIGCGTHAGLFGLAFAVAETIALGKNVGSIQFHSMDPSVDMPEFGHKIWHDFLDKAYKTKLGAWLERAVERIQVNTCQRLVDQLVLPNAQSGQQSKRWALAMHAVYDESIDDLRDSFRWLHRNFEPNLGVLTAHHTNLSDIETFFSFSSPRYLGARAIKTSSTEKHSLKHIYKQRRRDENTFAGIADQICEFGEWHDDPIECPKDTVIRIFKRVAGQRGETPLQITPTKTEPSYLAVRNRILPIKCRVDNQKLTIVHPPRGQTYRECESCGAKYR